jgi:hypothetical protein
MFDPDGTKVQRISLFVQKHIISGLNKQSFDGLSFPVGNKRHSLNKNRRFLPLVSASLHRLPPRQAQPSITDVKKSVFLVPASYVTIKNPDLLSSSETGVNQRMRSSKKHF